MKDKPRTKLYCYIMNIIKFRYWFCGCHYRSPYGLVIMDGCPDHDIIKHCC
jgi:hypothetical protein